MSIKVNQFVIANPNECIGCATCMSACYDSALKRGKVAVPRLIVTRDDYGVMPNQCRQWCDDAPCARVCPVDALRFGDDNIELHEELCIGCKMCVLVCPFGAIRMEDNPRHKDHGTAVKCDLCKGLDDGPACVSACPTSALKLFDSEYMSETIHSDKGSKAVNSFITSTMKIIK